MSDPEYPLDRWLDRWDQTWGKKRWVRLVVAVWSVVAVIALPFLLYQAFSDGVVSGFFSLVAVGCCAYAVVLRQRAKRNRGHDSDAL